jgi:hypothetical protein
MKPLHRLTPGISGERPHNEHEGNADYSREKIFSLTAKSRQAG